MVNNDKIFKIKHKSYNENKIIIKISTSKRRHKFAIMNIKSGKKEGQKCKTKGRKEIDMDDTMNYLQKHSHSKSLQKEESLLQKKNPYEIKLTNVLSTRRPKTTYVEPSNLDECLKRKKL